MYKSLDGHELPSYIDATSQDHWKLIAPYIPSDNLCSASLACSRWHEIFAPQLWGNPASHFGTEDDSVYVALTRFRRTLPWARLYVRQMTHTLHLPPAHTEIYEGPHAEWLRDMLERLPRLQCLVVEALPFFDHGCLVALRRQLTVNAGLSTYHSAQSLRLLNASRCSNATYSGLAAALYQFPGLLYLDLSKTSAARHPDVLRSLKCMRHLQVLKLSNIGLKDNDAQVLAKAIRTRVRSLNVSHNQLTDASARTLLEHCFRKGDSCQADDLQNQAPPEPGGDSIRQYFGEALEMHLQDRLISDFADRLVIQDDVNPGVTHLYLSDNLFTVEGISSFLLTGNLQCLDAGTVATPLPGPVLASHPVTHLPGIEKLVTTIKQAHCENLAYLRIGHEIATREAVTYADGAAQLAEMCGSIPMIRPQDAQELDGQSRNELGGEAVVYELGSRPVIELEADRSFHEQPVRASERVSPQIEDEATTQVPRRGSAFAPEITQNLDASGTDGKLHPPTDRPRTYSVIMEERKARAAYRKVHSKYFTPSLLPRLRTLVLCDVPDKVSEISMPQRIIRMINECAQEADLAKEEARQNYTQPPGSSQKSFERHYLQSIFPLERIVLEMAEPESTPTRAKASWRIQPTSKATTEDVDSEAFWDAAQHDFTFFDEEECGQPRERASPLPSWFMDPVPTMTNPNLDLATSSTIDGPADLEAQIDVIAEITKYRRERRAVKQTRIAAGLPDESVEGFWDGQIRVIRPDQRRTADEARDCYGNVFEKGFRYR